MLAPQPASQVARNTDAWATSPVFQTCASENAGSAHLDNGVYARMHEYMHACQLRGFDHGHHNAAGS
jgi:hypothetical protein